MGDRLSRANITVYDPALPGNRVLRVTTGNGHMTRPTDTPANTFYLPVLKQPADMSRHMFAPGTTSGRSKVGLGDVILTNADGALDGWQNYAFDGWPITIEDGTIAGGFTTGLVATMDGTPDFGSETITIHLRDRQAELDVPLQKTLYLGTNALPAGLEGVSDIKGKPKPFCLGQVLNVPAVCVNTSKLIYQVHDGALADIPAIYDRGVRLNGGSWPAPANVSAALNSAFGALWSGVYVATLGLYVVVGGTNTTPYIYTSPDFVTWTSRATNLTASTSTLYAVAWSESLHLLVAVGGSSGTEVTTSPDGITWTRRTTGLGAATAPFNDVIYSEQQKLFVIAASYSGVAGQAITSPDGITWTQRDPGFGITDANSVVYQNGLYVMVASGGKMSTSPDGITWTLVATSSFGSTAIRSVVYGLVPGGGGLYVAVADAGKIATSVDGTVWTQRVSGIATHLRNVTYGDGVFLAVGQSGRMLISTNGIDWSAVASGFGASYIYHVFWDGRTFVVDGDKGLLSRLSVYELYATHADLLDDTLAPPAGQAKLYLAGGYFRLGSKPAGTVTADVLEGATAADRTVAQLFKRALLKAGKTAADYVAADLTALDALNSAVCGLWINDATNASAVLDQIAGSIWAWWSPDRAGLYRIKQFAAPSGAPTFSFTANDLRKPLEMIATSDVGKGVPAYRTTVRYARNYTVQTSDLAASVSAPRRVVLAAEWQAAKYETAGVQTAHLLAPAIVEDSCLVTEADALAEASRRQGIRGTRRGRFPLLVELTDANAQIDFGDVGTLTHKRFGLAAGTLVRVLGCEPNKARNEVLLTVWR